MAVDIVKRVHQIWVGPPMPDVEQKRTAVIKKQAHLASWAYKLYGLNDLTYALEQDIAMQRLTEYCAMVPTAGHFAGLLSDYARIALVNKYAGLYLDTDWIYQGTIWPEFPATPDLYGLPLDTYHQQNCILWAPTTGCAKLKKIQQAAQVKICALLPPPETLKISVVEFVKNIPVRSIGGIVGPYWVGSKFGNILTPLPNNIASFFYLHRPTAFVHKARWRWTI